MVTSRSELSLVFYHVSAMLCDMQFVWLTVDPDHSDARLYPWNGQVVKREKTRDDA
jgi:hypothetical protein